MARFFVSCFMMCLFVVVLFDPGISFARPDSLIVDLADNHIDITTGFDGAHLILFGVKERPGEVVVVVRGPERTMLVRKKERVFGAWMNRRSLKFRKVPSYYDYAVSVPEKALLSYEDLKENGIGLDALYFDPDYSRDDQEYVQGFQEALIRTKQLQSVYPTQPEKIRFLNGSLFRTEFYIPANVPPGDYVIRTFLIDDQQIMDEQITQLRVAQVGFSATLYSLAYNQAFLYGLICIFIALSAGWGINLLRR